MPNESTLDAALRSLIEASVRAAIAPLAAEVSELHRALDERMPPAWMTRDEAAARLQCDASTIDRMVSSGRLRAQRLGRAVRIDPASLRPVSDDAVAMLVHEARAGSKARKSPVPDPTPGVRLLSVAQTALAVGVSTNQVRALAKSGKLAFIRIGKRLLIPREAAEKLCVDGIALD